MIKMFRSHDILDVEKGCKDFDIVHIRENMVLKVADFMVISLFLLIP